MRILIIDVEFLVALEAEQVLMDALNCAIVVSMPRDALHHLHSTRFDVILADASVSAGEIGQELRRLFEEGQGLIFASVDRSYYQGVKGFAGVPVIAKPFDDDLLVALAKRLGEG